MSGGGAASSGPTFFSSAVEWLPERTSGRGQDQSRDLGLIASVQALVDRVVLAVPRAGSAAAATRRLGDDPPAMTSTSLFASAMALPVRSPPAQPPVTLCRTRRRARRPRRDASRRPRDHRPDPDGVRHVRSESARAWSRACAVAMATRAPVALHLRRQQRGIGTRGQPTTSAARGARPRRTARCVRWSPSNRGCNPFSHGDQFRKCSSNCTPARRAETNRCGRESRRGLGSGRSCP